MVHSSLPSSRKNRIKTMKIKIITLTNPSNKKFQKIDYNLIWVLKKRAIFIH